MKKMEAKTSSLYENTTRQVIAKMEDSVTKHIATRYAKREFVETTIAFKDIQKHANILQTINHVLTKINVLMPTIGAKVM